MKWLRHPKSQILATPEVVRGEPIFVITYNNEYNGETFERSHPGTYCGFAFFHRLDEPPSSLQFYDFDSLKRIDAHVEDVIENAIPGLYTRDSNLAPFTWEDLDFSEADDGAE